MRRLCAAGVLAPGDSMPSVREVAQALAVNPMTVSKAYGLLEMEGVLERARGVGMLVARRDGGAAVAPDQRVSLLRPTLERAAQEARQLELDPDAVIALFRTILKGPQRRRQIDSARMRAGPARDRRRHGAPVR